MENIPRIIGRCLNTTPSPVTETREVRLQTDNMVAEVIRKLNDEQECLELIRSLHSYKQVSNLSSKTSRAAVMALSQVQALLDESKPSGTPLQIATLSFGGLIALTSILDKFIFSKMPKETFVSFHQDPTASSSNASMSVSLSTERTPAAEAFTYIQSGMAIIGGISAALAAFQYCRQKPYNMHTSHFLGSLFDKTSFAKPFEKRDLVRSALQEMSLRNSTTMSLTDATEYTSSFLEQSIGDYADTCQENISRFVNNERYYNDIILYISRAAEYGLNSQKIAESLSSWILKIEFTHSSEQKQVILNESFGRSDFRDLPSFMADKSIPSDAHVEATDVNNDGLFYALQNASEPTLINWYKIMALGDQIVVASNLYFPNHSKCTRNNLLDSLVRSLEHTCDALEGSSTSIYFKRFLNLSKLKIAIDKYNKNGDITKVEEWYTWLNKLGITNDTDIKGAHWWV